MSKRIDYHAYLLTDEWGNKRAVARRRAGGRCRVCGTRDQLHTHHKTYKHIGAERQHELVVLCATHHRECHAFIKNWKAKGYKKKADYTLTMKYVARERAKHKKKGTA